MEGRSRACNVCALVYTEELMGLGVDGCRNSPLHSSQCNESTADDTVYGTYIFVQLYIFMFNRNFEI